MNQEAARPTPSSASLPALFEHLAFRPAARRGPRSHSGRLVLLCATLRVPLLQQRGGGQARADAVTALAGMVDRFVAWVRASGGSCLGIADLTLLACWSDAEQGSDAAASALASARLLASELTGVELDHELRVAVVSGSGLLGVFGGVAGHWQLVASGGIACATKPALDACAPGELVVSDGIPLADSMGLHARLRPGGLLAVDLGSLSTLAVPEHIDLQPSAPALAPCTIVAFEICGADISRGDYPDRLHGAMRSVQRAARLHGGVVLELRHDHRGLFAVARFDAADGRTGRAALRGLRFGQELVQALGEQGLDAPTGVATGEAWCWPVGANWAVLGDTVSRAVDLARSTASELLCDLSCATLTRSRARLEALPVSPRGPSEPSFVVEHVEPSRGRRFTGASGTVGRREQLSRLDQVVGEFLAGTTGVLLIEGENGLGKSRMVDELVARLRDETCRVVIGYGVPGASAAPLAPWRSVTMQLLGLDEATAPEQLLERLEQRLGERMGALDFEALEGMLPLARVGSDAIASGDRLLDAAAALIMELQGGRALLVVLEDAQWLDSASWSLARQLAVQADQLLLVPALRTEKHELELEAQRLASLPETTVMVLRGIGVDDIQRLLQHELGIEKLPGELLRWLASATSGNPRLCLEWLRLMQDEGSLELRDGHVVDAPSAHELASWDLSGLAALLVRRVALLAPAVGRTLAVCAVAGGLFETELLVHVHPDGPGLRRVEADLEHLAAAGLVQPAPGRSEPAWMVGHAAVTSSVQAMLQPGEAQHLHGAVAGWYEQNRDDLSVLYPLLAQHWIDAGVTDKALGYLELAGAQAMRAGAMPEAIRHYQRASRLAEAGAEGVASLRRAHWERSLGDARYACGDLERCSVHFDRALIMLHGRVPQGRFGRALYAAGQVGLQALHLLLPLGWFQAGGDQYPRLLEASHAAERLAERYYYSADVISLCACSVLSANLADQTGQHARNARPYASMSYLIGLLGFHGLSERVYDRACEIGASAPDPTGLCVARYTRSTYFAGRGEWAEALELAELAIQEAEGAASWQEAGVARTISALCHFMVGSFGMAEERYGELLLTARTRYNAQHEAWALYGIGQCQHQAGRLQEAARSVQKGLAVLRNLEDYPSRLICHGVLASIHARLGHFDEARESADLAWTQLSRVPLPFVLPTLEGCGGLAEAYLTLLEREQSIQADHRELGHRARHSVKALGRFASLYPVAAVRHQLAVGRLALVHGKPRKAEAAWRRALEGAERYRIPFEAAQARAALAGCPGVEPSHAAELRALALEAFERLGCAWHKQQLELQQGQSQ